MNIFGCRTIALAAALATIGATASPTASPTTAEIRDMAASAYTFAYPLVLMDVTRRTDMERRSQAALPGTNQFVHARAFPDDRTRIVIRPNADTLYSTAWLDLSQEPILLHVPDTHGRYYVMQLLDAWTETFGMPGKRTGGTGARWFGIVGPDWKGILPPHVEKITSPTNTVWLLGRTQVNGIADYDEVHAIQAGFALMPLSRYPDGPLPPPPPGTASRPGSNRNEPPPMQVQRLSAREFFQTVATLLKTTPSHAQDAPLLKQLARLRILPGKAFDPESLGVEGQKAFEQGVKTAKDRLAAPETQSGVGEKVNGWSSGFGTATGRYGINYEARAAVARLGLGALPPEEATYLSCRQTDAGQSLSGEQVYRLHFPAAELPPVHAFWSLTLYGEDGYFVGNAIHRFAIGDRDALKYNSDGSLDLFVQRDPPGADRDSNWLPAPNGKFNLSLRLYWPGEDVVRGRWKPPPVTPQSRIGLLNSSKLNAIDPQQTELLADRR
ncbi:MAG TPA: DUF1254 domain-containing protein [Steroidobacteraceae bacterium]|jgi:hypothetical protein